MIPVPLSRRELLTRAGVGMGLLGLHATHGRHGLAHISTQRPPTSTRLRRRSRTSQPKAKRVIHIFANGEAVAGRYLRPEAGARQVRG